MRIKSVVFFVLGGAMIAAAFFAEAIGLDNDPGWGRGRIAILVFGILLVAWGLFCSIYTETAFTISRKIQLSIAQHLIGLFAFLRRYWYTLPIVILVILVYIWFASSGSWTRWEPATRYYAELANSFKHRKLYLPDRPNSELLNLSNPYDPVERRGVKIFIDYSLYNGKYYLYWGPVPALLLMMVDPLTHGRVGDLYLVFNFVCGIFLLQFLLILNIWDQFFRDLPKWILSLSVSVAGLISPWTYMLINEPNGRIYEAAITGAQFFLLAGFLIAVLAFKQTIPSPWLLTITGFLWALAFGTRLILVVPIGFLVFMIAYRIWKTTYPSLMNFAMKVLPLAIPLSLSLIGLGWYNWVRFGSVFETGFSYALAAVNLQKYHNLLFSPVYIIQNLYNYVLKSPASTRYFPFIHPEMGIKNELFEFYSLPEVYETSPITGLFLMTPFLVFIIVPIITLLTKNTQNKSIKSTQKDNLNNIMDWMITSLFGAFLSGFGLLMIFFWAAMRYMGDFLPALTVLSILGFWQGYQLLAQKPHYQKIYLILGIILAGTSVIVNLLLSISVKYRGWTGV
jgi:hypothetical protein